ncbi:MAG: DNA ligase D [Proteobacteria bacterium]|nr:DNA ligase D [Pseudomonadota bacterium]
MPASLDTYRAKRDFTQTLEPSGQTRVGKAERARFVIQKHDATRLHYDLRLEFDGVFKSWAVTKGPSLDPHERRLAVEVEDHPLDYGDFEGTIPKGQYGGGTVMLWDRGWWEPEEPGTSIEKALKKGHLSFRFDGERLKGGWTLIRMRNDREGGRGRNNWLLIKHEDETAHEEDHDALLEENAVSIASGRTMQEIAEGIGKGPKPFITKTRRPAKSVWHSKGSSPEASAEAAAETTGAPKGSEPEPRPKAKAVHGKTVKALPDFIEPQLTKLVDAPPVGDAWAHEIKFDGYRMQLRVEAGRTILRSRKGLDWTHRFPEIAEDATALPDGLYDGEIVALDDEQRPDFAGLQAALSDEKTGGLIFFLFDALMLGDAGQLEDLRDLPLTDRKARLQAVLERENSARLRYVEHFLAAGEAVLQSACRMSLEGVVSKRVDAPYRSGRGDTWVKAKCRGGQEVVIAGWTTTGDAFRSLIAGVWRGDRFVHVGRIGTGFGRDKVDILLPKLKALETDQSPFTGKDAPRKGAGVHWVKPELVAEIGFAGWTGDGHIRQASFKGLREDKPSREVRAEEAAPVSTVEDEDAPKPAKAPKANAAPKIVVAPAKVVHGGSVVLGTTISHPDKILWPATADQPGVSKLELARYIEAVGQWMVPYVQGRPCSIIRTPDGIEGKQRFFQRHAGRGTSALITQVTVSGDREPYLQFDSAEALVAGAQSGATEFHPWNSLPGEPNLPGRFVFDLDPDEGLDFQRVIEAAKEVRDRLEAVGLTAWLKTTGGKGLHVVTILEQPKKNPVPWPEAKAFAQALCVQMAADSPQRYTTNMAKIQRKGRIFLDYLRNDRMSSAAALLTPRARPGAPVSMPLSWSQAKKGLDPKAYTIRTAVELMNRRGPWAGWEDSAGSLKDAIRKLQ